jgi:hypothetical protein
VNIAQPGEDAQRWITKKMTLAQTIPAMIGTQSGISRFGPKIRNIKRYQGKPKTRVAMATVHGDGVEEVAWEREACCPTLRSAYAAKVKRRMLNAPEKIARNGGWYFGTWKTCGRAF